MKDTGGPAFPCVVPTIHSDEQGKDYPDFTDTGMTLQDWFAGQVLEGAIAGRNTWPVEGIQQELCAKACYDMADAMIAERSRR